MKFCKSSYFIARPIIAAVIIFVSIFTSGCHKSNPVAVTTGNDTTSHEYAWQGWTFGENSGSIIYDIAVINENDIWAVGQIYMNEPTGQTENMYNAAHWDGAKWELKKILVRDYGSLTGYFPIKSVFAFSSNNIWFASYADLIQWDGNSFSSKAFFMTSIPFYGQVNKMWGTDENNVYCVGDNGAIFHYTGKTWQKIETGTSYKIYDIKGSVDSKNNIEIYAVAAKIDYPVDRKIFSISGNTAVNVSISAAQRDLVGLWFQPNTKCYAVGDGMFVANGIKLNSQWSFNEEEISNYYLYSVDGQALNDITVSGSFGELQHYNGNNWRSYRDLIGLSNGEYYCVKIKNNMIIAAGYNNSKAVIAIGKR
jgi:hypothetical protein